MGLMVARVAGWGTRLNKSGLNSVTSQSECFFYFCFLFLFDILCPQDVHISLVIALGVTLLVPIPVFIGPNFICASFLAESCIHKHLPPD